MKKTGKLVAVLMTAAITLSLSACSGSGSSSSAASTASAGTGSTTTINMWHYFDDTSQTALKQLVSTYNSSQKDINIKLTYLDRTSLYNQLTIGAVSGELPDIAMIDNPDVASFIKLGILEDITDAATKWGQLDKFYSGPMKACYSNGKLYAIVNNTNCLTLVANMKMLKAAGYSSKDLTNMTWDTFTAIAKKTTDKAKGTYGFSMSCISTEEGTFQLIPFIVAAGGSYKDMSSAAAVSALKLINTFTTNGYMSKECVNWTQSDAEKQFLSGKSAMTMIGTWMLSSLASDIKDSGNVVSDYQLFLVPSPKGDSSGSCVGGETWAMTTKAQKSDKSEAISKFFFWLCEEPQYTKFCEISGKFPCRSDTMANISKYASDKDYQVMSAEMKYATARGPESQWGSISKAIYTAEQSVALNQATPDAAGKTAAEAISKYLDK